MPRSLENRSPVLLALALAWSCGCAAATMPQAPAAASPPEDGNWRMPARDLASTRYSALDQINAGNVKGLTVAFTFSPGTTKGQESAVLAVDGTLYFVTSFPNYLIAIDLSKPGGALNKKNKPMPDAASLGIACCQPVNRGPVFA